jgi:tRNA(Ile2) C34 agmatinyltransferase TiaS
MVDTTKLGSCCARQSLRKSKGGDLYRCRSCGAHFDAKFIEETRRLAAEAHARSPGAMKARLLLATLAALGSGPRR